MFEISIHPSGEKLSIPSGSLLLSGLLEKKPKIARVCGGKGACATCHVYARQGMDHLSPMEPSERRALLMIVDAGSDSRLACQTHIRGSGVILEFPQGIYIERADDLLSYIGYRSPENILHPIRGQTLIQAGKVITRTILEQCRIIDEEVRQLKKSLESGIVPIKPQGNRDTKPTPYSPIAPGHSTASFILGKRRDFPILSQQSPKTTQEQPTVPNDDTQKKKNTVSTIAISGSNPQIDLNRIIPDNLNLSPNKKKGSNADTFLNEATNPRSIPEPTIGSFLGKFLLVACIGKGGLGLVYRAFHTTLNISVAIKVLRSDVTESIDRFRAEARLLAQLNHTNVVRILDFEDDPVLPYVVMELIEGMSIQDLLSQMGRIKPERTIAWLLQTVDGLEAAWRLGIVHRDVKPANILVSKEGIAKVVDFGLAVRINSDATEASRSGRSDSEAIHGTVMYMCPERAQKPSSIDHRADIYSLGITFFQMITGRLPFIASNDFKVLMAHHSMPMPAAHEINTELNPAISEVISRMTEKQSASRYQTYGEARTALKQLQEKLESSSPSD